MSAKKRKTASGKTTVPPAPPILEGVHDYKDFVEWFDAAAKRHAGAAIARAAIAATSKRMPAPLLIGDPTVSTMKAGRTFSSTVDERLMKTLEDARAVRTGMPTGGTTPAILAAPVVYGDGEVPLSSIITFSDGANSDMPIMVFTDDFWDESMRQFIPEVDTGYIFPRDATEAVVMAIMQGDTLLAHGPKGSGKTTLPQQVCARMRMPYIRINCRMDMESGNIFGSNSVVGGELKWNDGPAVEIAKHGGVLCIDEISRTPSGINASLMAMLERGGIIYLGDKPGTSEEKTVRPHKWARWFATDNTELQGDTTGKYVGTNVQDEAMIDRFATTIKIGYLHAKHEEAIIEAKYPETSALLRKRMVQMAAFIRQSYDSGNLGFTMSPRGLLEWARKVPQWNGDIAKAFKLSFYNKLVPTDKKVVAEFYHSVFSENLTD